ncbi:MAG: DUF3276 family protein [Anaerolineae bacterium]|nr:DUF3276 family protein [Phycisphaerae bacterium]
MPPNKSGKQDAKPLTRTGSNAFPKAKPQQARPAAPPPPLRARGSSAANNNNAAAGADEQKILFQKFFKSVGPRTYAAQIKQARNGNYFLVLTEGKRDPETDEVRKTKILIFSEDFKEFFHLLTDTVAFLREHPVPEEVKQKRERFWAKRNGEQKSRGADAKSVKPPPAPIQPRPRPPENKNRR